MLGKVPRQAGRIWQASGLKAVGRNSPIRINYIQSRNLYKSAGVPGSRTNPRLIRIIMAAVGTIVGTGVALSTNNETTCAEPSAKSSAVIKSKMEALIRRKQQEIIKALEEIDGKQFFQDEWSRQENGGGGISGVLEDGNVFEKAGVNISIVNGRLPPAAVEKMRVNHKSLEIDMEPNDSLPFYACGLSMIVHPINPLAPTVHLNYRYFETQKPDGTPQSWWFGGGADLTPSYLYDEDAILFHQCLKDACDGFDASYYDRFKKWCDEYFYNKHRKEARGIGGIFFDDFDEKDPEKTLVFIEDAFDAFLKSYVPITNRRKDLPYTDAQHQWQQLRRGRYVEFNLVHDRGTAFGLNTPGARVESILVSMPRTASWKYNYSPEPGSEEDKLLKVLQQPVDWLGK